MGLPHTVFGVALYKFFEVSHYLAISLRARRFLSGKMSDFILSSNFYICSTGV